MENSSRAQGLNLNTTCIVDISQIQITKLYLYKDDCYTYVYFSHFDNLILYGWM